MVQALPAGTGGDGPAAQYQDAAARHREIHRRETLHRPIARRHLSLPYITLSRLISRKPPELTNDVPACCTFAVGSEE